MTTRLILECKDCEKKYRVRYGLGNNYPQEAAFNCHNCSNKIKIGLISFQKGFYFEGGESLNDQDLLIDDSLTVQNLHPEIPTKKKDVNDPYHFQTMEVFRNIQKSKTDYSDFRGEQFYLNSFNKEWKSLEKPLRILAQKGENKLQDICSLNLKSLSEKFEKWIYIFINKQFSKEFKELNEEYVDNRNQDLDNYIKQDDDLIRKIYDFCKIYMDNSTNFQATILHQKFEWDLNEEMVANIDWDSILTVYGDLYEIIGDLFVLPTIINNVQNNRPYNQFKTPGFDLPKYLISDKANRANNFKENRKLNSFSKDFLPWLRNGTHHRNSHFKPENNSVELGTGKGGKNRKEISIVEYVRHCNTVFGLGLIMSNLILHIKSN